ncbi:MAG: phosphonate C-P lyase system protein PhnH [Proteobacteria bacterium]|nr:MAG: phosphonate C-P lyase system protein PhnH [Pseudomonadota bacterium]
MHAQPAFPEHVLVDQAAFRAVMAAMARPGTIVPCPPAGPAAPAPLAATTATLARALLDYETPFWLDSALARTSAVGDWIRFQTGAALVTDPRQASFAFLADPREAPPFESFSLGTDAYPDRSTTLVLQVERFGQGRDLQLRGPGIAGDARMSVEPLPIDIVQRLIANRARFPRGIDLILVARGAVAALPRSTRVTAGD